MTPQAIYFETALRSETNGQACQIMRTDETSTGTTVDILVDGGEGEAEAQLFGVMAYKVTDQNKLPEANGPHVLYQEASESGGTPGATQSQEADQEGGTSSVDPAAVNEVQGTDQAEGTSAADADVDAAEDPLAQATKL